MSIKQPYLLAALIAFVLAVYYPALFSPLCLVDDSVLLNSLVDRRYFLSEIFFPKNVGYYRPLLDMVYSVEDFFWMLEESFLHLDNVIFHLTCVVLVYFTALQFGRVLTGEECRGAAFTAAALFGVLPVNTEAVNWISGRTDPLAGIFVFLSLFLLLKSLERSRTWLLSVSSLSLFIACLAKESALFAYPGMLFLVYCFDQRAVAACQSGAGGVSRLGSLVEESLSRLARLRQSLFSRKYYYLAFTLVPILYFALRNLASSQVDRGINRLTETVGAQAAAFSLNTVVFKSLKAMGFYLKKIFFPWPLNFTIVEASDGYVFLGILLVALLVWLLWRRTMLSALFVLAIAIGSSGVIAYLTLAAWTPFAERYLYMPSALFAIGMVYLLREFFLRYRLEKYRTSCALLLVGLLAISTVQRNFVWMDGLTLYIDCVNKAPKFWRSWENYAVALIRSGRNDEAKKIRLYAQQLKKQQKDQGSKSGLSGGTGP
jgi:hypothetical protein